MIVSRTPMACRPGTISRPRAPTISPTTMALRMPETCMFAPWVLRLGPDTQSYTRVDSPHRPDLAEPSKATPTPPTRGSRHATPTRRLLPRGAPNSPPPRLADPGMPRQPAACYREVRPPG